MDRKELEDMLLVSKDETLALKRRIRELEDSERKLTGRLQRAMSEVKKTRGDGGDDAGNQQVYELQEKFDELKAAHTKLISENTSLQRKVSGIDGRLDNTCVCVCACVYVRVRAGCGEC